MGMQINDEEQALLYKLATEELKSYTWLGTPSMAPKRTQKELYIMALLRRFIMRCEASVKREQARKERIHRNVRRLDAIEAETGAKPEGITAAEYPQEEVDE